jgi:hypothetical protein
VQFKGHGPKPEHFPALQAMTTLRIERCFDPSGDCPNPAINAHSVQKARYLRLLATNGHVMTVNIRASVRDGVSIDFESVGINVATTFTGLCAEHDERLFAPIEKNELDLDSPEHLFLLAYRSVVHELHSQIVAANRMQGGYQYGIEQGWDDPNTPSEAGLLATHRWMAAYDTYVYKSELDNALLEGRFDAFQHHIVKLNVARPTVATCAYYSVDDVFVKDEMLVLHLNVLPVSQTQTIAVFSYVSRLGRMARRHLRPMLRTDGSRRLHDLSRLLIEHCGNLVLAPDFVESWDTAKREAIVRYFMSTAMRPLETYDSPHFDLFVAPV